MSWWDQKTEKAQINTFWQEVADGWESLKLRCRNFHPVYQKKRKMPIEAGSVRAEIVKQTTADPLEQMELAKKNRDVPLLQKLMSDVWFGMPESHEVREQAGFGLCCDICSDAPIPDEATAPTAKTP